MLEVNNVNISSFKTEKAGLKDETKKKLEALGIDPSTVRSEADAKVKIKEAEAAQAQVNVKVLQGNEANPMQQIFTDAKDLAEKIGLKINPADDIKQILDNIEKKIKDIETQQTNLENEEEKLVSKELREEFNSIYSTFEQAMQGQAQITGEIGVAAKFNKINSSVNKSAVTKEQVQNLEAAQNHRKDSLDKANGYDKLIGNSLLPEGREDKDFKLEEQSMLVAKKVRPNQEQDVISKNDKNSEKDNKGDKDKGIFGFFRKKDEPKKEASVVNPEPKNPFNVPENIDISLDINNIKSEKNNENLFMNGIKTRENVSQANSNVSSKDSYESIRALAHRLGIPANNSTEISSLFTKIEAKINSIQADNQAKEYQQEFERLRSAYLNGQLT